MTHHYAPLSRQGIAATACGLLVGAGLQAFAAPAASAAPAAHVSAAAPTRATTAAAVGTLHPGGPCQFGVGVATCDIWAQQSSVTIAGTPVPIWGFSDSAVANSATLPAPSIVVNSGDTVSITVHNDLGFANENVSLALPGQPADSFSAGGADDTAGAAPAQAKTYTFTAGRPGTFVYEAGHTDDGARQVAMGLAGALVVLPTTAPGTAYGTAATKYDDDAVLVLSDVDPALNAHPFAFDMRSYAPSYRLINGKAFPETNPIGTDQGHTVLMRYVNVGSVTHPMSVLGAAQVQVADDGHPLTYASTVTTTSIEPGQTVDSLVTMPTGPESKLAVYEANGHLDTDGKHTADPQQIAFGGMMAFLDTNAPPPSTDDVGPVSTNVSASPNPSDATMPVTVTADLSDTSTGGSNVTQAEFVVDDPSIALGYGTSMPTGTFGSPTVTQASGTLPATGNCDPTAGPVTVSLDCLSAGKHTIFVRALDSAGNWGVVGSTTFNLPKTGPQTVSGTVTPSPTNGSVAVDVSATGDDSDAGGTITNSEYFLDTVGANGTGTALIVNRPAAVVSEDGTIPVSQMTALTEGTHHVLVHSKNSLGLWGPPLDIPVTVDRTGPTVNAVAVQPQYTNTLVGAPGYPTSLYLSAQFTDPITDSTNPSQNTVVRAEAFIDTVKAPGTGLQLVATDGKFNSTTETAYGLIPLSQVRTFKDQTTHQVYVRALDSAGNWTTTPVAAPLVVDRTAPVLTNFTAPPTNGANPATATATVVDVSPIPTAEYWIDKADPGVGKATPVASVTTSGASPNVLTVTFPTTGLALGSHTLNLRVRDAAGNWSAAVTTALQVTKPNPIFASTFETPGLADWFATSGTIGISPAAALNTSYEPGTANGMTFALSGTNTTPYVTDITPTAETGYHARFAFNRNTLTTTSNVNNGLTILNTFTKDTNGTSVFSVQFRMSGTQAQLRTVLGTTANPTWVNLAAGTHKVQVDWTSATAGSVALVVDGTTLSTQTGNTSAARVERVQLGVSGGYSAPTRNNTGTTGSAYFDSFASGRTVAP